LNDEKKPNEALLIVKTSKKNKTFEFLIILKRGSSGRDTLNTRVLDFYLNFEKEEKKLLNPETEPC